jgi:hypothetical protein
VQHSEFDPGTLINLTTNAATDREKEEVFAQLGTNASPKVSVRLMAASRHQTLNSFVSLGTAFSSRFVSARSQGALECILDATDDQLPLPAPDLSLA